MKKNITKTLVLSLGLALFIGCSPDSDSNSEIDSLDLTTIINPDTARAEAEFDNSKNGIYKGVFVSDNMSHHGVLTVNLGNDSRYNAILEYGENQSQKMGFVRVNNNDASISNVIEFRGKDAGFTLNVSDYNQPVVTEAYVNDQRVQAKLLKETSTNQVRATLGSFTDDGIGGNNITGTWDILGSSVRVLSYTTPLPPPNNVIFVPVINISLVVVTKNGTMYTDETMEDFTPELSCLALLPILPPGPQAPFFSGDQFVPALSTSINEYAAGEQNSDFGGVNATWSLFYSQYSGNKYYDINCNELPLGGTWSWNGSSGNILVN